MAEHIIVTLDGPAGVGKTTLARNIAEELGIAYMDTGAMFRSIGWKLGNMVESVPPAEIEKKLAGFRFSLSGAGAATQLSLNGTPVGDEIRTEEVALLASAVATLPVVRTFLKKTQQKLGSEVSLVAEGRDMGTVIFPAARYKFFLDATPEERARRRYEQLTAAGETPDLKALTDQIRKRDHQDRSRVVAPLRPADDAIIIDTTELDVQGVFAAIMSKLK
ncbi:(d)CMP kinase [Oleidesulfovibrio alaskensis]|uniref:(d)CMP kinase n=1 Tax=Oleidesulfovibrio alaskensis TaxID=58180 RepID=UPI000420C04F|nr:(d)CMP kinase [Oleidesulfovibrio alaskensis]